MKQISANITGSFILNGVDLTTTIESSSIWSGSIASRVSSLEQFSSSLDSTYATDVQLNAVTQSVNTLSSSFLSYTSSTDDKIAQLNRETASLNLATASLYAATASLYAATASINSYTASNSANVANLFATSASLNAAVADIRNTTASLYAATASINSYTASNNNNVAALYAATASLYNATASIYGATSSLFSYSASATLRINALDQYTASLNTRSASFACVTATNNFACTQYFSNTSNAVGFSSTGSLYSDGGMRITKDMYVSGTAFFNNVTVFGTQSINYISSSQLNIASNIISVNTATPSVRFGGLAVYDSGSLGTGLTGSLLWDSQDNQWIYSNPSGSEYDSALFLVGPRSAGPLGSEVGISCNFLSKGNGLHHMTSSGIFEDGSRTCFYGNTVIGSGGTVCTTMANASCVGIGTTNPITTLQINAASPSIRLQETTSGGDKRLEFCVNTAGVAVIAANQSAQVLTIQTVGSERLKIDANGISCFACQVCTPILTTTSVLCSTGGTNYFGNTILAYAPACDSILGGSILISGGYSVIRGGTDRSFNIDNYINSSTCVNALKIFNSGIACFGCTTCAPTLVAGTGGIRTSNNIIFPANLTTYTIWNEGYGGAVQLRRSDATTDRYARIGIVDAVGNWVSGMTIDGGTAFGKFDAGICAASAVCAAQFNVCTGADLMASFTSTTNNPYIRFGHSDGYKFFIGESNIVGGGSYCGYDIYSNCGLRFYAGAVERMRITSAGLVGINTTNFGERLNIGCGGAIAWQNTCNCQKWHIQYRGTEDGLNFVESAVADFRLFLKAGGNVGIGVNPNYKLEVSGNACFTGGVAIGGSYCAFALNVHGVTYQIGGSTWVQNGYGYVNAGATTTGLFPQSDSTIQLRVGNASALTISSNQISCFSNTVCTPGIYVGTNQENTILSSSRIHLNTCVQRFYTINHWQLANGSFSCTVTDPAATYGCAKVMPLGGSSTYFFGPYSYLTPGSYVAKFRMKVDNNSSTSALFTLDTNRGGGVQIAPSTFCTSGCYQYINIPFTISSPSDVFEARGLSYNSGITCAYLDHVLIEAAENPGQYFSKDNFRLYAGAFGTPRLSIDTSGNTIFNCNGTYCSNYAYNFLGSCNGSILSGAHIMGNMGAGTQCATPLWCSSGALRMEFNWASGNYINWANHNNCTPMLFQWSADNYANKHCFDYVGNACHCGIVIARGFQGAGFSTLSAGSGTSVGSFDTITRSGVGLYEVAIVANPNAGGSDYYDFWYGRLLIGRGYSGAAVTDYLVWCQESTQPRSLYPSGGGNLTVTACMFQNGVESTCIGRDGSYTIRFKISGYNSSYTGANTTIFMKLII